MHEYGIVGISHVTSPGVPSTMRIVRPSSSASVASPTDLPLDTCQPSPNSVVVTAATTSITRLPELPVDEPPFTTINNPSTKTDAPSNMPSAVHNLAVKK